MKRVLNQVERTLLQELARAAGHSIELTNTDQGAVDALVAIGLARCANRHVALTFHGEAAAFALRRMGPGTPVETAPPPPPPVGATAARGARAEAPPPVVVRRPRRQLGWD